MPHKCMNCGKVYEEGSEELLKGCECGSTLFLYEKGTEEEINEEELHEEKSKVLKEIENFLQGFKNRVKSESKVRFDLQSIRVLQDGVYEINLKKLLRNVPLIVEIKEGKYHVHLASVFKKGGYESFNVKELEDEFSED